jgi:competence protein ComEA
VRAIIIAALSLVCAGPAWAAKFVDGAVNLNTAPPEVLALLPGVGPSKAQAILAYRKRHPFRTVDELVRIKGIGRKMVRAWRAHLAVGGPTTAVASAVAPAPPMSVSKPTPPPAPRPVLACARPFVVKPRPPPRVPRRMSGACWPAP